MRKIVIVIGIILMFIISGCGPDIPQPQKSAKLQAQEKLLSELEDCNHKYDTGSSTRDSELNKQYCDTVLSMLQKLIEEGYFDDATKTVVGQTKIDTVNVTEIPANDLHKISNEIMGNV